jgi:cytosine/adenosine deaminase-related metal-dependent hydrolase
MGHGWAPVVKSMQYGLRPSLSIDVVTTVPGDMFTQIRAAFASERARVNAVWWEKNEPAEGLLTAADMLKMATLNGAHVAGLESKTGSLTPGKKADVVVIETQSLNMAPIHDPEAAVTLCADTSNVDTVVVNGSVKKRKGKLLGDVDRARRLVQASRDYLVEETERRKQVAAAAAT